MEWGTIFAAVGGALLGAALGGFIRDWIAEKYFRPKLYILGESVVSDTGSVYHRILVKNAGRRAAENCIGMITVHHATGEDVWEEPGPIAYDAPRPELTKESFAPIKDMLLCWSRLGNPEAIVINRDTTRALELYRSYFESHMRIPTEGGWQHYRVDLKGVNLKGKEYSGEIRVTSANAEPAWASFRLIPARDDVKLEITERRPALEEGK